MIGARRLHRTDDGASAVEYSLLLGAIAAVIVLAVFALGILTRGNYGSACQNWNTAANTTGGC